MKFRDRMERFFSGRNGNDQLNMAIFGVYMVLLLVSLFLPTIPKYILFGLAIAFVVLYFIRSLSRNLYARQRENAAFMRVWSKISAFFSRIWSKISKFFRLLNAKWKYRKTHVFVSCPKCRETLRLPKGKGRIAVTCPKCGNRFEKKV